MLGPAGCSLVSRMGETPSAAAAAPSPAASPSTTPVAGRPAADLRTRARALGRRPWARELAAVTLTCVASLVVATTALRLWDSPDLHIPLAYGGDGLGILTVFKG